MAPLASFHKDFSDAMQLTRFTDLGLQVVMQMASQAAEAANSPDTPLPRTTTSSVSEAIGASQTHVAKVVARLAEIGVIRSTRGRTGGILLTPEALDFSLGTLIRELEEDEDILESLSTGGKGCPFGPGSPISRALIGAQDAFYAVLDSHRVGDMLPPR